MITATATESPVNYLNHQSTVASWLLTKDHKRIGLMYMVVVTIAFIIGAFFAAMIRMELATPAGDLVSSDVYNRVFTMHGVAMVFFVLIPAVPAILGNFVLPLMLGAKDVAFPKLNLLSWYVFVLGLLFTLGAMVYGGVDTGWTFYPPYSTEGIELERAARRHRRLHHRLLVDPHRPQFHGDDPPHARARADLVPAAAVRLGRLRDRLVHGAGHAGGCDHRRDGRGRARLRPRLLRPARWAATRCSSSTCSGSIRTRRSTS